MRHANSNLNILKKKRNSKIVKLNNFLKPPLSYKNINSPMTTKNVTNKNILYNLLYKDSSKISLYNTKNTTNTLKNTHEISNSNAGIYSFNSKVLNNNNSLSIGNSLNVKEESKKIRGHINIRLKLNDKIINNYSKKKFKKTININMIEKIKEKDIKINKLQMDLFQSQELLNKLQKEKQKELSFTYNSIKSLDNINLSNDKKYKFGLGDFFSQITEKNDRILKTNYNKYEMNKLRNKTIINNINRKNKLKSKNNYKKNNCNNKKFKSLMKINSLLNLNSINKNNKNKRNYLNKNMVSTNSLSDFWKNSNYINANKKKIPNNKSKYFSSNSTNRLLNHNHNSEQFELCKSLTGNALSSRKNLKSNNSKNKGKIKQEKCYNENFIKFTEKCEILKTKANKIFSNYIMLVEYINKKKVEK